MTRASTERSNRKCAARTATVKARPTPLSIDEACRGLVSRSFCVAPADVVFVKSVIEASEGVASVFAETGGELCIAAPMGRQDALDALLIDLARELPAVLAPFRAIAQIAPHSGGVVDA